jgi:hypothetical protein
MAALALRTSSPLRVVMDEILGARLGLRILTRSTLTIGQSSGNEGLVSLINLFLVGLSVLANCHVLLL